MLARMLIAASLLATPAIALAQDKAAPPDGPPKQIRSILLYGDQKCPEATNPEEIVVCANAGDSPYRIPKRFRNVAKTDPASTSWVRKMEVVQDVNRLGLPNGCSPVGSGGQTGCTRQFIQQWAQEKLEKETEAAKVP